jgi:beta-1,4-mannosyltransferase
MADAARLRVLFLPDFSASNPYQRELAGALRDHGVDVVAALAPRRDPIGILRAWWRFGRPPVVHLHWLHNYLGQHAGRSGDPTRFAAIRFIAQLHLLRLLRVRLVWTVHNLAGHDASRGLRERDVHRRLAHLCHVVICHCDAARDAVIRSYDLPQSWRPRLHVIPHGNYIDAYPHALDRRAAKERLGLPEDSRVLLFFGAVRRYKGLDELLDAFGSIADPRLRLLVVGEPRPASAGEALQVRAAADPRITLRLGFAPDDEAPVYLSAADAVVLPFRDVLTSGSAILAMSFGRALIAPALGCLPQTVPAGGGVLYAPDAPDGLAQGLRTALAGDLDAMGARNLERARTLSWVAIAAATAALYRAEPATATVDYGRG